MIDGLGRLVNQGVLGIKYRRRRSRRHPRKALADVLEV
jgi:hypothetical protein